MSLLILHRNPFEPFPYDKWLHDYDKPVVILAAREKIEAFAERVPADDMGYARLEVLDRYDDEVLRERALELAKQFSFSHVVAHHEADLQIAAWLREHLGLSGAYPADVLPFRDKSLMKQRLAAAGVEVAQHVLARTEHQARRFAEQHGFPVVSKERDGYNSIGLRVIRDRPELEAYLEQAYASGPREDTLIEAFVPGRMCHVDGLVIGGRTVMSWACQYQYDLASFGVDTGPRIDLALDTDDPLTDRLLELADRALAALKPQDSRLRDHAFHAEIFHTPDDRLVLCEIACRSGGGKIREVIYSMFERNLAEDSMRAELGLPLPGLEDGQGSRPIPKRISGQLLLMKRPGLIRRLPEPPQEPWVQRFWMFARPGDTIPPASGSSDFLTAVIGSAPTRAACERGLRELGERFMAEIDIVEA